MARTWFARRSETFFLGPKFQFFAKKSDCQWPINPVQREPKIILNGSNTWVKRFHILLGTRGSLKFLKKSLITRQSTRTSTCPRLGHPHPLVPLVLDLTLAARHPVDAHFSQPTRLDFTVDYDGGHHGVGGRRVVSKGKSSGVALARLGRSLGARSTRNTGKWCLVSALRVRRHSALVALVARLPKLDPLLAGSTTLSLEIVLGRKLMWPGQTSVVAVSPANRVGRSGGSIRLHQGDCPPRGSE